MHGLAKIVITVIIGLGLGLVLRPAAAQEFVAKYQSGSAPLTAKSKVTLTFTDNALTIRSIDYDNEAFILPIKSIRGITPAGKGCWLYWFDAAGNTVHAFFKSKSGCPIAQAVNQAVHAYYQKVAGEEQKERFLEYQRRALEEAQ